MQQMPKCPGCGAAVAEEGDVCDHCLSTALAAVLDAEKEREDDEQPEKNDG
jgi:predicted amidophosphoribosyltransferase